MAEIIISDVTEGKIDGVGAYDVIMQSIVSNLELQFNKNRIKGAEYANVYLGSIQTALSQSIQFVLGQQAASKQAELLDAQILSEGLKQDLINVQIAEQADSTARANVQLNDALATSAKQREQLDSQIILSEVQIGEIAAESARKESQNTKDLALKEAQLLKVAAEVKLLGQKFETESNQTDASEQQALLYAQQIQGFKNDFKFKAAKLASDNWAVSRSVEPDVITEAILPGTAKTYIENLNTAANTP